MDEGWVQKISERSMQAGIIIGVARACALLTAVQGQFLENKDAYDALQELYVILKTEEGRLEEIHDNRK